MRWANSNAEANGKNPSPVVPFVCKDFSPEDFSVVAAKILNRCYIDEDKIKRAWDCLEYFGPFNCVSSVHLSVCVTLLNPYKTNGSAPRSIRT